jgi:hypothetical protein
VDEIKHWVMGFGEKVEVISPDSLRESIAETARQMARTYFPSEQAYRPDRQRAEIGLPGGMGVMVSEGKGDYSTADPDG